MIVLRIQSNMRKNLTIKTFVWKDCKQEAKCKEQKEVKEHIKLHTVQIILLRIISKRQGSQQVFKRTDMKDNLWMTLMKTRKWMIVNRKLIWQRMKLLYFQSWLLTNKKNKKMGKWKRNKIVQLIRIVMLRIVLTYDKWLRFE